MAPFRAGSRPSVPTQSGMQSEEARRWEAALNRGRDDDWIHYATACGWVASCLRRRRRARFLAAVALCGGVLMVLLHLARSGVHKQPSSRGFAGRHGSHLHATPAYHHVLAPDLSLFFSDHPSPSQARSRPTTCWTRTSVTTSWTREARRCCPRHRRRLRQRPRQFGPRGGRCLGTTTTAKTRTVWAPTPVRYGAARRASSPSASAWRMSRATSSRSTMRAPS